MSCLWKNAVIHSKTTIMQATHVIDKVGLRIAFVIDETNFLLGIVTDVEVRRAILTGITFDQPVSRIMNIRPYTVTIGYDHNQALHHMQQHAFVSLPVLDHSGKLIDCLLLEELFKNSSLENPVILMAGGLGSRLHPLTEACPKPLLKVGGKPILENILEGFIQCGFSDFYITLNYKGQMIQDYFGDGSRYGISIQYINEEKKLGTAGALSLLPIAPEKDVIVMNADLLTTVNYRDLLSYHHTHTAEATVCVREYNFTVPYGVIKTDNEFIRMLEEKPTYRFFINAGIYVLSPRLIQKLKYNEHCDITTLLQMTLDENKRLASFPLHEYWMDIGRLEDYTAADKEYHEIFA